MQVTSLPHRNFVYAGAVQTYATWPWWSVTTKHPIFCKFTTFEPTTGRKLPVSKMSKKAASGG